MAGGCLPCLSPGDLLPLPTVSTAGGLLVGAEYSSIQGVGYHILFSCHKLWFGFHRWKQFCDFAGSFYTW